MIEFYPQIRYVHIACIVLSGALFLLRGSGVLAGARWPMLLPVRIASYGIDTVLLTAALMLLAILPGGVFANGWLTVKLALLVVYIVLGSFALKRAKARSAKTAFFTAAVATYLFMYSIARAHDPAGILRAILN
ncbi:MAG: SirB2 family protein [Lysobacteraceae bacterium]